METKPLTKTEQKWFEDLKAVIKRQPKNIFIYCTSDELNLIHLSDGVTNGDMTKGYDPEKVITSVSYRGDAGAW